ncbi:MAG TPA: ComEC/Rec2 family competence protein [Candidatus Dormibacteraeota bacterium]|nr:ComEC/Rec2 family competence protein [Candidatus Dormibacteraeota bacterium]
MIDSETASGVQTLARLPGLLVALTWSVALTAAVVMLPSRPAFGAIAIALAVPCLALALMLRPAVVAIAIAVALMGVGRAELPAADPNASTRAIALAGQTATITGRVSDDSRPTAGGSEVLIEPNRVLIAGTPVLGIGNLMVRWRGPTEAGFGDQVQASGKLSLPRDLPTFDRRAYLAQRHVFLELATTRFDVVNASSGLAGLPRWLRTHYTAALDQTLPAPHAAVLEGVVLGIRQGIPPSLQNALIATGLVHLLVLSGLKVAVFARIVQGALQPLLGRHATWPAIALIGVYALVGGATPAATRACVMGGLAIAASHIGRPTHVWTSLAITAAAMLAWHPELAWDVGFQLSFAGTASIILLTPVIERRIKRVPAVLREPFAVTCAAQIGTLPMMATDFHVLSPVAPFANALVLPILPVLVAGGLLLGPLSLAPDLARLAALPMAGLLAYLEQVAFWLAKVPAAAINVPHFPIWVGVAYYSGIGPAIAGAHSAGRRRAAALATAVLAPTIISGAALGIWANAPPQASVLNVGDGQAVLLRGPQGAILIDSGPSPQRLKDELGAQLPPWQSKLDAVVITAPTLGHIGGFAGFDRPAGTMIIPDAKLAGSAWRTAVFDAKARGATIASMRAGSTLNIAGFTLQAVAPEPGAPGDQVGAAYLGLRVLAPSGRTFCDLSDLDVDAQTVAAARLRGPCTYLLLPGGGRSLPSPELERAAGPTAQMIVSRSAGRLARGFPPTVLRTDQEGTITVQM